MCTARTVVGSDGKTYKCTVDVEISNVFMLQLVSDALRNKTQRSQDGPVSCRIVGKCEVPSKTRKGLVNRWKQPQQNR
jgi:hypothetical protein